MAQIRKNYAEYGSNIITSITTSGDWFALSFLADTVFQSLDDATLTLGAPITSITFKQGDLIFGHMTRINLTSGAVMAYQRE